MFCFLNPDLELVCSIKQGCVSCLVSWSSLCSSVFCLSFCDFGLPPLSLSLQHAEEKAKEQEKASETTASTSKAQKSKADKKGASTKGAEDFKPTTGSVLLHIRKVAKWGELLWSTWSWKSFSEFWMFYIYIYSILYTGSWSITVWMNMKLFWLNRQHKQLHSVKVKQS